MFLHEHYVNRRNMKRLSKILAVLLAVIMVASLCACKDNNTGDKTNGDGLNTEWNDVQIPDSVNYFNSGKEFNYYTYKSINAGNYRLVDGTDVYVGESFVTKEYIKEYFESGMKWLCPQVVAPGRGSDQFNTSEIKKVLDMCHELGYDKSVVLTDNLIYEPYHKAQTEVNNGAWKNETDWDKITCIGNDFDWQWSSTDELDDYFETRMRAYALHPAFQGVYMPDEPGARYMKIIGEIYQSLRRVQEKLGLEEMFININMLPYYSGLVSSSFPPVENSYHTLKEQRDHEAYRRYIRSYFEETQADYVQVDIYPMLEEKLYNLYMVNMQILAEVAKEYDAKIIVLNQTHSNVGQRITSYESLNYMNNLSYAFGAVNNAYYSYFTLDDGVNNNTSYIHRDNCSMMTRFGDKTYVYDIVKELNTKGQRLALSILNFDYTTHGLYYGDDVNHSNTFFTIADDFAVREKFDSFTKLTDYSLNKEISVVTELYDQATGNYMYAAFNATDPLYKGSSTYQTAKMTFTNEYNKALVFFDDGYKVYNLDADHSLTVKMRPGEAHYVIPYAE